jgi:hypothetical protein
MFVVGVAVNIEKYERRRDGRPSASGIADPGGVE